MAVERIVNLTNVFEKADTPDKLRSWLCDTLEITSISDLLGYVEKGSYEREWRDLITGAFPIVASQEAQGAVEATEGHPAQPARPATHGVPGPTAASAGEPHAYHLQDGAWR